MKVRIIIYSSISEKLKSKHGVSALEVEEAFLNREGFLAKEMRPQNQGMEDRFWFYIFYGQRPRIKSGLLY